MLLIVLQPEIPMPLDQSAVAVPKLGATLTRRPCKRGNCTPLPQTGDMIDNPLIDGVCPFVLRDTLLYTHDDLEYPY